MDDFGGLSKHSVNGAECVGNGCVKQVQRVVGLDRLCNGWCGVGDCSQQHLSMTTSQKFKDRNPVERVEMYNVNSLDVSCVHGFSFGFFGPFRFPLGVAKMALPSFMYFVGATLEDAPCEPFSFCSSSSLMMTRE